MEIHRGTYISFGSKVSFLSVYMYRPPYFLNSTCILLVMFQALGDKDNSLNGIIVKKVIWPIVLHDNMINFDKLLTK